MTHGACSPGSVRPMVLVPAVIGAWLIFSKASLFWGLALIGLALFKLARGWGDGYRRRLQPPPAQTRHGGERWLKDSERREIVAIEQYSDKLAALGGDRNLAKEVTAHAWQIVGSAGGKDATEKLRAFRLSLPVIEEDPGNLEAALAKKIAREVEILRAAKKEVDSLS